MKVILKREVDNLGLAGDVVDVADGYGRNYLLPRGMAILATKGAMKEAEALTRSRKATEAQTLGAAEAARQTLEARTLRIEARVDERGSLYGSVSAGDVQRLLKERGHDVQRKRIELRSPIKEIGSYEIPVHIHPQVSATVTLDVVDIEGKVLRGGAPEPAAEDAVADSGAESTDAVDELAEQAIEAAEQYEAELAAEAEDASDPGEQAAHDDTDVRAS